MPANIPTHLPVNVHAGLFSYGECNEAYFSGKQLRNGSQVGKLSVVDVGATTQEHHLTHVC